MQGLITRAQFDLQCPQESLRVTTLDEHTKGITGCGQRATYLEVCDMTGWGPMNCKWVANNPRTQDPIPTGQVVPGAPPPPMAVPH